MRDNEILSSGYPFKSASRYDNEEYVCCLSENDKIQGVVSKLMETILRKKIKPSKDNCARIVHRGKRLCPVDEIFPIFRRRLLIIYCYFSPKKK